MEYRLLCNYVLDNFPPKVKSEYYCVLASLYHVDGGSVTDISEVHTTSMVSDCSHVCKVWTNTPTGGEAVLITFLCPLSLLGLTGRQSPRSTCVDPEDGCSMCPETAS